MKRAIIFGVNGQDGSYLADLLLAKQYEILGTSRSPAPGRLSGVRSGQSHLQWDLKDETVLVNAIDSFRPDEIYNLAAYSSGAGMFDVPVAMGDINGLAVTRILSCIERSGQPIRFCQASSSEVFGNPSASPQSELTAANPRTPYGSAKLYADSTIRVFRRARGLFACSAILFNHESPRRGAAFVTTKVTTAAARIAAGLQTTLPLGGLEARRDWGHAREYVEAMWLMLQQDVADDFVVATGRTHSVADLCDTAFSAVGLDYKNHVVNDPLASRPAEAMQLVGDASKAKAVLGWSSQVSFRELVEEMVFAAKKQLP